MTPPPDLAKCANCNCWFAVAATDEVFHHATKRCRSEVEPRASAPIEAKRSAVR
jgi:hypothetical protein